LEGTSASPHVVAQTQGGSCLSSNGKVVISAPYLDKTGNLVNNSIISIINPTSQTYFVPWKSPLEWGSFLQVVGTKIDPQAGLLTDKNGNYVYTAGYCPPQPANLVDDNNNACGGDPVQLGNRYEGNMLLDIASPYYEIGIPYYGAEGDVQQVSPKDAQGNPR